MAMGGTDQPLQRGAWAGLVNKRAWSRSGPIGPNVSNHRQRCGLRPCSGSCLVGPIGRFAGVQAAFQDAVIERCP